MSGNTEIPCFTMELDEDLARKYALAIWEAIPEAEKLSHGELIQKRLAQDVIFLSRMVRNLRSSLTANETQLKIAKQEIAQLIETLRQRDITIQHLSGYGEGLAQSVKYVITTAIGAGIVLLWQWLR